MIEGLNPELRGGFEQMTTDYSGIVNSILLAFAQEVPMEMVNASFLDTVKGVYDLAQNSGVERARQILIMSYRRNILPAFLKQAGN